VRSSDDLGSVLLRLLRLQEGDGGAPWPRRRWIKACVCATARAWNPRGRAPSVAYSLHTASQLQRWDTRT